MATARGDGAVTGGPRSEPARARILAAAREEFARDGYDGATIRAIADRARIDPSLVMRYFGSKEGLFAAAAVIDLELPALRAIPRRQWGEVLVRQFLDRWEGPDQDGSLRMLFRVAPTNATAAARLGNAVSTQVAAMITAAGLGNAQQRADLMASQMLGLAYTRTSCDYHHRQRDPRRPGLGTGAHHAALPNQASTHPARPGRASWHDRHWCHPTPCIQRQARKRARRRCEEREAAGLREGKPTRLDTPVSPAPGCPDEPHRGYPVDVGSRVTCSGRPHRYPLPAESCGTRRGFSRRDHGARASRYGILI